MAMKKLMTNNFLEETNPFKTFEHWLNQAKAHELNDPNAMALSSIDFNGMPNVRIVLLKDWDERGFVFYTNMESQKGEEVLSAKKAAVNFHWKSLRKQIRIRGITEQVSDDEADAYFASRPRLSQLGAWASKQSRPLDSRQTILDAVAALEEKYINQDIPRPDYWQGTRIKPLYIEFWQDGDFRLHDRCIFQRSDLSQSWQQQRWYP